jgi:uncharacterized protein
VLKVVIDTVVFVRCLMNPKNAAGRMLPEHDREYTPYISEPIIWEILEVITRPGIRRQLANVSELPLQRVLEILAGATMVDVRFVPSVSRDPKDDKFLALATEVNADYLITEDKDMLVLGSHDNVAIVDTLTFIERLAERS